MEKGYELQAFESDMSILHDTYIHQISRFIGRKERTFYRVPRVTAVIPSPDLKTWAGRCAVEEYVCHSQLGVGINNEEVEDIDKYAPKAHKRRSKEATDIGGFVHNLCEQVNWYLCGKVEGLISACEFNGKDYTWARDGYLEIAKKHNIQPIWTEKTLYCPSHAGTLDLHAYVDGALSIVDFKTFTGSPYWEEWRPQIIGGYRVLVDYNQLDVEKFYVICFNKKTEEVVIKDMHKSIRGSKQVSGETFKKDYGMIFTRQADLWWETNWTHKVLSDPDQSKYGDPGDQPER